jgi:hypothetical protein
MIGILGLRRLARTQPNSLSEQDLQPMDRDTLVRYLISACKTVFAGYFDGAERHRIEDAVERFFKEGVAHYSENDLLDLFCPPQKGFDLFSDYLEALDDSGRRAIH